jgi:hypothetical protein
MVLIGAFQFVEGLTAIIDDEFYVVTANYSFDLDTTAWGWIHLILGLLLLVTTARRPARSGRARGVRESVRAR